MVDDRGHRAAESDEAGGPLVDDAASSGAVGLSATRRLPGDLSTEALSTGDSIAPSVTARAVSDPSLSEPSPSDPSSTDPSSTERRIPLAPRPASSDGLGATPEGAAGGSHTAIHWRSLSDGLIFAMVIAGPCLLAAEGLRDRAGRLWLVPVVIAGVGFLIAGAIAGRHRRRASGAAVQGIAVALPVSILLVLVDVLYRAIGRRPIDGHAALGWIAAIVGAVVVGAVGALVGRWMYLHQIRGRKSPL